MKPNIDLTENRDFRKRSLGSLNRTPYLDYNVRKSILKVNIEENVGLYPTGTKTDINKLNFYNNNFEFTCECCGFEFNKRPWWRVYGLCKGCDDRLDSGIPKDLYLSRIAYF